MVIRPCTADDYDNVCKLLSENGVIPPKEMSDLAGICLVAEKDKEIQGCIWALTGQSTQAYVGYFATNYRTDSFKANRVGMELVKHLETVLRLYGIKRYFFGTVNKEFKEMAIKYGAAEAYKNPYILWKEV